MHVLRPGTFSPIAESYGVSAKISGVVWNSAEGFQRLPRSWMGFLVVWSVEGSDDGLRWADRLSGASRR